MKGKHLITIQNRQMYYRFEIERNINIIKGDSATGKTTLIDMIRTYTENGEQSGVQLVCDKTCRVLEGIDWEIRLANIHDSIVFIDEGNRFVSSREFAAAIKESDNYYVIVTREQLYELPYSVEAIYTIRNSGKYGELKKCFNSFQRLYGQHDYEKITPPFAETIITEDRNSGFQFFNKLAEGQPSSCIAAMGKSNLITTLQNCSSVSIMIVADGAALGPEMDALVRYQKNCPDKVSLFLPESFEWLILKSDVLQKKELLDILERPYDYIESQQFFSWEQYFTSLLVDVTRNTVKAYSKKELPEYYLQDRIVRKIEETMIDNE